MRRMRAPAWWRLLRLFAATAAQSSPVSLRRCLRIAAPLTKKDKHSRLGRLDRYHGKLRQQIGELFALRNSHVWLDALQPLVENHNTSPSRALKLAGSDLSPAEIGPKHEMLLRRADLERATLLRQRIDALNVAPGTNVRLLTARLKKTPRFAKSQEAVWTPEVYPIIERAGVNTFRVGVPDGENPIWPLHSLQIVRKALGQKTAAAAPAGPRVDVKVVRAKRLEARNVSEEEQAAAVKAPARAKRAAKPKKVFSPAAW